MNINVSEEIIEIGGKEYKLFLNRIGIVNWEKMTKLQEKSKEIQELTKKLEQESEIELTDDTNPFELYDTSEEEMNSKIDEMTDIYAKLYWVMLYTHHKLSMSEAKKLFDEAVEEYGIEQISQLANQMIEQANKDNLGKPRKNLKALKSTQD